MSLKDRVLDLLSHQTKPVAAKELGRRLGLTKDERAELKPTIDLLIQSGEVVRLKGAGLGVPARLNIVTGRLSCNPGGFGFVEAELSSERQRSVYVKAENMKGALHGDRVLVRIDSVTRKGPEGRVIGILERRLKIVVGRYHGGERAGGRVFPFDRRVLTAIQVRPEDEGGAEHGQMVSVEITRPATAERNPLGRIVRVLGSIDEPGVDVKVVMAKYELPDEFPAEVETEARRVEQDVTRSDIEGRTDFRAAPTVTVDPETARDHDDAISLERLPGEGWRLAVHIADVAHYVAPGSALDQEAYLRGTSVYFPGSVVPMLPHELSSGICSLVEGRDRLTQTVLLQTDGQGKILRAEFHDGVIRSAARMSYGQVQKIVDGDQVLRARFEALVPLFEEMDALAKLMRRNRYERGSLDFDVPEPKLVLGAAGEMVSIEATERLDSMRMIEEFMLAANEAVAAELSRTGVGALFRIHEKPDPDAVEEFFEFARSLGLTVPKDPAGLRPEDLQKVVRQVEGKPEERLLSYLLLRTMKLARYHEENLGHFGLATEMYAHFTSPIRRYPDLVVHRALRSLRKGTPTLPQVGERLKEMGEHLSETERRASDAERELTEWKKVRFMADKVSQAFEGFVTGVQNFGFFVELEGVFVQGLVHVSSMVDDFYEFKEKAHVLKGEKSGRTIRLGDRVTVRVLRVDLDRRQVDLCLSDLYGRAPRVFRAEGFRSKNRRIGSNRRSRPTRGRRRTKAGRG